MRGREHEARTSDLNVVFPASNTPGGSFIEDWFRSRCSSTTIETLAYFLDKDVEGDGIRSPGMVASGVVIGGAPVSPGRSGQRSAGAGERPSAAQARLRYVRYRWPAATWWMTSGRAPGCRVAAIAAPLSN